MASKASSRKKAASIKNKASVNAANSLASTQAKELSEEDLRLVLRNWPDFIEAKERTASSIYPYFREPTRSMIEAWNQIALQFETEHVVAHGMQLVDNEQFDNLVFGERIADIRRFIESNLGRIRGAGGSSRVRA
jgi:hypothetical protein